MVTGRPQNKAALARDVSRLMSEYSMSCVGRAMGELGPLGLTPGHMKMLFKLEPGVVQSMGSLAQDMSCDASTMTWLVDRLEERGFAERRPSTTDRRVKGVALTPAGIEMKALLEKKVYEPPPELLALDRTALETIAAALERVVVTSRARARAAGEGS